MNVKALLTTALGLALVAAPALAYEVVEVEDGGTLKGTVMYKGEAGEPGTLEVTKDQSVCHSSVPDESLLVGEGGGLAHAVVYFEEVEAGKDPASMPTPLLANKECRYIPHMQGMMVGQKLQITNEDPVLHNTHTYDGNGKTVFNIPLPTQGTKRALRMKKVGIVNAKCDAGHTWMDGWVWVNQNPYYAVTDANGNFEITDIPEGDYVVKVFHPKAGEAEHDVSIDAGGTAELAAALGG